MSNKNEEQDGLHVIVFSGPNGSGKTSLIDQIKEAGLETTKSTFPMPEYFINPDQINKDLQGNFASDEARDKAAFDAAIALRQEAMASRKPFAYETVMSHETRLSEMLQLKEQGYQLILTFITTDDPEKNVARVKQRYETRTTTGHYVEPHKVRDRYHRSLELLPKAAEIADAVFVYDNSEDFKKPTMQAIIERDGRFAITPGAKEWVHEKLVKPLQAREEELGSIEQALAAKGRTGQPADELRGTYSGEVICSTKNFVVQYDEATKQAVIHDKVMLDTSRKKDREISYTPNEQMTIRYTLTKAPEIERDNKVRVTQAAQEVLKSTVRPTKDQDKGR